MKTKKLRLKKYFISELSNELIESMWKLYQESYDCVEKTKFISDLKEKTFTLIAQDHWTGEFKGFSNVLTYTTRYLGEDINVIYSGDTMLHRDYWGQRDFQVAFLKELLRFKLRSPFRKLYWNLIVSGNRTYLKMANNCPTYYPRFDRETPAWEKGFINHIGVAQFGRNFDVESGVIKVDQKLAVLKGNLAPFTPELLRHPHIAFLVKKNPGYIIGDELSCIALIDFDLFFVNTVKCIDAIFRNLFKFKSKTKSQKLKKRYANEKATVLN